RIVGLDAGAPGEGTSGTSFAWLNAARKEPEVYQRRNADGMAAHRGRAGGLGGEAGHHPGGSLEWAEGDEQERELRARVERLARRGYPAEWISRERARALEPALVVGDHVREVALYAAEAWLDAPRLIRALLRAASACGAVIRERAPVRSLRAGACCSAPRTSWRPPRRRARRRGSTSSRRSCSRARPTWCRPRAA